MKFLDNIWLGHGTNGWGFICVRDGAFWRDIAIPVTPYEVGKLPAVPKDADVYFTPNLFENKERRKETVLPSCWLYADLDLVDPHKLTRSLRPTIAWQTSPRRYQGLWELPYELKPASHGKINKQLTYHIGADKSGWDATQVLRLPGTRNHKYDGAPKVKMLWERDRVVRKMKLRPLPKPRSYPTVAIDGSRELPLWLKTKLGAKVATGDRSKVLWRIECGLFESGYTTDEVFSLVKSTVWNKFKDDDRLIAEIHRAAERARGLAA